jgi:hypothetical protein
MKIEYPRGWLKNQKKYSGWFIARAVGASVRQKNHRMSPKVMAAVCNLGI